MSAPMPLEGIRVIDFTQVMMGPCATQMLADYGADVIKIEKEKIGDLSRWSVGDDPDGLTGPIFKSLNRNKRSVALDLRRDDHKELVRRLIAGADVVVNNFRPDVMERMGFSYEACKALNPKIVYAVGTGYGLEGPYQKKGGQDVLAQALTGVMERRQDPSLPLSIYATTFADYSAGMHLVQGVLLALLQRAKTGEGQRISVSLYSSMLAAQMQEATSILTRGKAINWAAMPLTGVFQTTDGAIVMVGAFKENPLRSICEALEIEDLSAQERYADLERQRAHKPELQAIFKARFASDTSAHWLARLEGVDILCAPVRSLQEALDDPQTAINGLILDAPASKAGPVRLMGSPITMEAAPVRVRLGPPDLGAHTAEVMAEMGLAGAAVRTAAE